MRAAGPLRLAESVINGALKLDPEFLESLGPLSDKTISVALTGLDQTFHLRLSPEGVTFLDPVEVTEPDGKASADVVFRGSPPALLRMVAAMRRGESTIGDDVRISGDVAALAALRDAFRRLDVDLEELLSRYVGDITAHEIGRAARAVARWGEQLRENLLADVGEYLVEELRVTPPRLSIEDFAAGVDRLRDDVERLEKRVSRLNQ